VSPPPFLPPRFLRNPHVQSVLAYSSLRRALSRRRRVGLEAPAQEILLECGEGVRLQGFHTSQHALARARGLAVLLHGWEGSAQSTYLLHTGVHLLDEGFDVFRLNMRDHGDTHHLNDGLFHSNRIDEVVGAVGALAKRFVDLPMAVVGYSLGGNFALRIALRAPAAGIPLVHAVAVCPVISPAAGLASIETALWFYEAYFLKKWRGSLRRKAVLFPKQYRREDWERGQNLRGLTRQLVEQHTDFGTLERYLEGYSLADDRLAAMQVPSSILTAADDPIIPVEDFRRLTFSPAVRLEIAAHGGHCGFLRGLNGRTYAEEFIAAALRGAVD